MNPAIAVVSVPQLSELITAIRDIVKVVHAAHTGPSTRTEFISYLERVIALLEKDQRYIHVDVVKAIKDLQLKLRRIVGKLSPRNSLLGRLNALSNGEGRAQLSEGERMSDSPPASVVSTARGQDRGHTSIITTSAKQVCACGFQDQTPMCPETGANTIDVDQGPESLLIAAYKDCLHHRHLVASDPSHLICLASSLDRLAKLLRKSGEAAEATKYSQEAVEIYRRVANAGLGRVNEPRGGQYLITHG
ncbi:unnamed protein product [Rhizoctonia solani]|uniref:Uncharacterized protein n=2 Tax=Rhizoctonia solani TaxID=456999 RepID=A0A8H3HTY7_9AGAM|nr:unnamed protein product [Rhizoctonia solani]